MTEQELRDHYTTAYKIIQAERRARLFVFRDDPARMKAKVAEMDKLLWILQQMKDELKRHVDTAQPRLLDVPGKVEYK